MNAASPEPVAPHRFGLNTILAVILALIGAGAVALAPLVALRGVSAGLVGSVPLVHAPRLALAFAGAVEGVVFTVLAVGLLRWRGWAWWCALLLLRLSILSLASQALGGPSIPLVVAHSSTPELSLVILVLILAYYLGLAGQFGPPIKPKAIRMARIAALSVIPVVLLAGLMLGGNSLYISWHSKIGEKEANYEWGHAPSAGGSDRQSGHQAAAER
jgi:hypothetical protein